MKKLNKYYINENLILTRVRYGFCMDEGHFLYEGQIVTLITNDGRRYEDYQITSIFQANNMILITNSNQASKKIKIDNIIRIEFFDRRTNNYFISFNEGIIRYTELVEFSIDGLHWYCEGQVISFEYNNKFYPKAHIKAILNSTDLLVSCSCRRMLCEMKYVHDLCYVERRRILA